MPEDSQGPEIVVEDEVDALRVMEDQYYSRNRAQFGRESLDLISTYLELYDHLFEITARQLPTPIDPAYLFRQNMILECRADLLRTMLLLLRGHLIEAHGQTRRAIECCVWARQVKLRPDLVKEWLEVDMTRGPSKEWRDNMKSSVLFPNGHPRLTELTKRYQQTSRCVHPFRFSFAGRTGIEKHEDGRISVTYSFFDPEEIRMESPTRFLWTLQTHDILFDVFEEVFAGEIFAHHQHWRSNRGSVLEAQKAVGRFWIAVTERNRAAGKQHHSTQS